MGYKIAFEYHIVFIKSFDFCIPCVFYRKQKLKKKIYYLWYFNLNDGGGCTLVNIIPGSYCKSKEKQFNCYFLWPYSWIILLILLS